MTDDKWVPPFPPEIVAEEEPGGAAALTICLYCGYVRREEASCPGCGRDDGIPYDVWFGELTPGDRLRFARERGGPLAENVERLVAEEASDNPLL